MSNQIAIVAALEYEVKAGLKTWHVNEREHAGRLFKFYESQRAVLVCGGIGPEPARRAAEAIISLYKPMLVVSIGLAGALDPELKVGSLFTPRTVIDAGDSSSVGTGVGNGVLVSFAEVASAGQKSDLAKAFNAQAVDMEAAAVARGAKARGVRFGAVKAISDERDFVMPPLQRFIQDGQLQYGKFALFAAAQPWLWPTVVLLALNSWRASKTLCGWLEQYNTEPESLERKPAEMHPISKDKT
ncbi:MAG TPA: hypothetical protein VH744_10385 [Terriglobales bacterium]|jgi:adenosylhomocysteine nucleosidase